MELLLTIWSGVAAVMLMAEIHCGATQTPAKWELTALLLTSAMATVTMSNHLP